MIHYCLMNKAFILGQWPFHASSILSIPTFTPASMPMLIFVNPSFVRCAGMSVSRKQACM